MPKELVVRSKRLRNATTVALMLGAMALASTPNRWSLTPSHSSSSREARAETHVLGTSAATFTDRLAGWTRHFLF